MPKKSPARARKPAKQTRKPTKKSASRKASLKHVPTRALYGWITHTDLSSRNPAATEAWCAAVLGWQFRPPMSTPAGPYHLFTYSERGGGGIRAVGPAEMPSSVPYVHVEDAQATFDQAIKAGAEVVSAPERVMEGVTIAVVRAPGGVVVGLSGP